MKKILEVLQYSDMELRFNTDVDVHKNKEIVLDTMYKAAFTMITKLWGGNELSVLAMIRVLAIADLAVSVNREEMIRHLDEASADLAQAMAQAREEAAKKSGATVITFPPGIGPGFHKS